MLKLIQDTKIIKEVLQQSNIANDIDLNKLSEQIAIHLFEVNSLVFNKYHIKTPEVNVTYNGQSRMCNEYTARNIILAAAKGEIDHNLLTINGYQVQSDGYIEEDIPEFAVSTNLIVSLFNITK